MKFDNSIFPLIDPLDAPLNATEAWAKQRVLLRLSEAGGVGWVNNRGVAYNSSGTPVRFGLANTSSQVNRNIKSSDIIGIVPVVISPEHIGQKLGVFVSIETKRPKWRYSGSKHENAQFKWLELVRSMGGISAFSTGILPW